jgi:hypothetical protein
LDENVQHIDKKKLLAREFENDHPLLKFYSTCNTQSVAWLLPPMLHAGLLMLTVLSMCDYSMRSMLRGVS